jgi:hypothetical protein
MHQPDSLIQFILISVLLVVWVAFLIRTVLFVRLEIAGIGPLYPESWNPAQRKALENFRLLVGLALVPLWLTFIFVTSSPQANAMSGYLEPLTLISMIAVCYAWTLLLAPRDLRMLDVFPRSFLLMFIFLVLWWILAFSALGWMLTKAATRPPLIGVPNRAYADRLQLPRASSRMGDTKPGQRFATTKVDLPHDVIFVGFEHRDFGKIRQPA